VAAVAFRAPGGQAAGLPRVTVPAVSGVRRAVVRRRPTRVGVQWRVPAVGSCFALLAMVAVATAPRAVRSIREWAAPRDMIELLSCGAIEARTVGARHDRISLLVRRLPGVPYRLRIPAGTYFVPRRPTTQPLANIADRVVWLPTGGWQWIDLPVVCTDRTKRSPRARDTFQVRRTVPGPRLARLIEELGRQGASQAASQAAIWIATDEVTWDRLVGPGALDPRLTADDVALALKACADAGIDIRGRAAWHALRYLVPAIRSDALRQWWLATLFSAPV
jgi:hypothetical protein